MHVDFDIRILFLLIACFFSFSTMIYFLFIGRKTHLQLSYVSIMLLLTIWTLGQVFEVWSIDRQTLWTVIRIKYFGACFIGVSNLIFALVYTGYINTVRKHILLLLSPTLILYIILLTNEHHNLFFSKFEIGITEYGMLFWIHTIISYSYCAIGLFLILKYSFKQSGYIKRQSILIIIALNLPFFINIIVIINLFNPIFDITPISFIASYILFAIATFKYRFMDIVPLAFKKIMSNISESIIVIDSLGKIINFNKAFESHFSDLTNIKVDLGVSEWINELNNYIENSEENKKTVDLIKSSENKCFKLELNLVYPQEKFYYVNIQPISDKDTEVIGKIIMFSDITKYKKLFKELDQKNTDLSNANKELVFMNKELENYALTVDEVVSLRERNRMARDIHDTLGHTLTLIVKLAEVSKINRNIDEDLEKIIEIALKGIKEIRRSVSPITLGKDTPNNLIDTLNKLVSNFTYAAGVDISFSINLEKEILSNSHVESIYKICQESITNSIRHGCAKHISLQIKAINNVIKVFIFDDGKGCKTIKEGFGLKGIKQRIYELNGQVNYFSKYNKGFTVDIEIPMVVNNTQTRSMITEGGI